MRWTPASLPDQSGKTFVITGGNSGLGLESMRILAGKGARVVFTARSERNATGAIEDVKKSVPGADVDHVLLDLASLASVDAAAEALLSKCPRIDALLNNAGVMQTPASKTKDGFELQLGTNHLGHFRLGARLFARIEASAGRIVPVSSIAHKMGRIDLDDLFFERRRYDPTTAYSQSKLANLLFGLELHRRLAARGSAVRSIPCHPGYAATNLQSAGVGMEGGSKLLRAVYSVTNRVMAQPAEQGAWPLVFSAADASAVSGEYYGPTGFYQARGPVGVSPMTRNAKDEAVARGLWEKSEALVGPFFAA